MLIIGCDFHTRYQQIAMARATAVANPPLPTQLPQSPQLPPTPFELALPIRISIQLIIILIDNR